MKKILIILMAFWTTAALADGKSQELLLGVSSKIKGYAAYEVAYDVLYGDLEGINGVYVVRGNRYYIGVGTTDIFCDGKTKWEVNRENNEVTIDNVNPKEKSLLSNPTRAFDFLDGNFTHNYKGEREVGGKMCDIVELYPTNGNDNFIAITLVIGRQTGLPAKIIYKMEGNGGPLEINIKKILPQSNVPDGKFIFVKSKYPGIEIIDFR